VYERHGLRVHVVQRSRVIGTGRVTRATPSVASSRTL
jgi:hypothetical protein